MQRKNTIISKDKDNSQKLLFNPDIGTYIFNSSEMWKSLESTTQANYYRDAIKKIPELLQKELKYNADIALINALNNTIIDASKGIYLLLKSNR